MPSDPWKEESDHNNDSEHLVREKERRGRQGPQGDRGDMVQGAEQRMATLVESTDYDSGVCGVWLFTTFAVQLRSTKLYKDKFATPACADQKRYVMMPRGASVNRGCAHLKER